MTDGQFIVSLISPFLVLAGWFFVYRNSNRIAKRSEAYSIITKAVDKVLALDKRCADYWLAEEEEREGAKKWIAGTLSEIHGFRSLLTLLEKHHGFTGKSKIIMSIRAASTLSAEEISQLKSDVVRLRRGQQVEALSSSLDVLYGYYRELHD